MDRVFPSEPLTLGLRVLVVDDDADTRANLCDILELEGCRVDGAATAADVLKHPDLGGFEVVLLDRRLPDGLGDELLPALKRSAPEAAVVMVTGYADQEGIIAALRRGASDFLPKPVSPDVLRATLARIARTRAAERRALEVERLAAIGRTVTVLAHESRGELQRISASLEMLRFRLEDGNPSAHELVGRAQHSVGRITRLFEDLRNFAAPVALTREWCDVAGVLRQTWEGLTGPDNPRGARLHEDGPPADHWCRADAFRLEQVFRNLLENALAACPDPVEVTAAWSEVQLAGRPALRLSLRDNGPGLTDEQRRRVFEAFYTTKPRGTGLGLAITRRLLEAHGGAIAVGDGGPGAEFVVVLPRGSDEDGRVAAEARHHGRGEGLVAGCALAHS